MEEMTKADLALEQVWKIADELGRLRGVLEDNGVLHDDPAVLEAYDRTYRKVRALVDTLPFHCIRGTGHSCNGRAQA
jgi:hypothetical protein